MPITSDNPKPIVLMEGNPEITLAALLAARRTLPIALGQYLLDSGKHPEGKARCDRAFRIYHAMPNARQIVCLANLSNL